jgi:hypothetical protein
VMRGTPVNCVSLPLCFLSMRSVACLIARRPFPGCSIREVVISSTNKGEFAGVKPLGNLIRIEMAAFYTFDAASGNSSL